MKMGNQDLGRLKIRLQFGRYRRFGRNCYLLGIPWR